jgi:hypothetical protein
MVRLVLTDHEVFARVIRPHLIDMMNDSPMWKWTPERMLGYEDVLLDVSRRIRTSMTRQQN